MPPNQQVRSRLAARLGQLPHDVLAELAAQLCSDSPALQATAEKCMAAHKPLSHELVERALLSPDLLPCILGPLETEDGAAAAVCSQWLAGWTATNEAPWRRRLKQVPLDVPEELCISDELQMTATPDGRLVVFASSEDVSEVHILDRSMRVLQTLAGEYNVVPPLPSATIAADDASIFICSGAVVLRITQDLERRAAVCLTGLEPQPSRLEIDLPLTRWTGVPTRGPLLLLPCARPWGWPSILRNVRRDTG